MNNPSAPKTIVKTEFQSPLGPLHIYATEKGICLVEFADEPLFSKESLTIKERAASNLNSTDNAHLIQVIQELNEYFLGKRNF